MVQATTMPTHHRAIKTTQATKVVATGVAAMIISTVTINKALVQCDRIIRINAAILMEMVITVLQTIMDLVSVNGRNIFLHLPEKFMFDTINNNCIANLLIENSFGLLWYR